MKYQFYCLATPQGTYTRGRPVSAAVAQLE
jgi:hypothetical protein